MIKALITLGLLLLASLGNSQNAELLDTLKSWSVIQYNAYMNSYSEHSHKIKIESDTLIDNKRYHKVWINETENDSAHWRCKSFIRNDNGKIFYKEKRYENGFFKEYLLYDFNAQVGDTFSTLTSMRTRTQVKIDSIFYTNIFGDSVKTWKVLLFNKYTSNQGEESYWYEGIGSEKGLLYPGEIVLHSGKELLCYSYKDSVIYRQKGYNECYISIGINELNFINPISLYPNPVESTLILKVPFDQFMVKINSLTGQEVYRNCLSKDKSTINVSSFEKGVYFVTIIYDKGIVTKALTKL